MSRHKVLVVIPHGPADLGAEVEMEITFNFTPGAGPIIYPPDNADPGWPDQVEFVSCKGPISSGAFADLEQKALDDIAENWLHSDDGYEVAAREAADDDERAREHAAELRAGR